VKTLYLIRHAKSSWKEPDLSDEDRPLNKRGKKDAPFMGKLLRERDEVPDLMISSTAKRALSTAKRFTKAMNLKPKEIIRDKRLYMGGTDEFREVMSEVKDKHSSIMMFGHNPGLTDFVNRISEANIDNVPTSGTVRIDFDVKSWRDAANGRGKFVWFEYPKKYRKS
jgi:phosphohistidine phosphatase